MKGILLTEEMFLAATRKKKPKTQTRRIESSLSTINESPNDWIVKPHFNNTFFVMSIDGQCMGEIKPRYKKGEIVYLKEPFRLPSEQFKGRKTILQNPIVDFRFGGNESRFVVL